MQPVYGIPLAPIQWPQDRLIPPPGFGQMPAVDLVNAHNVGKEFFAYPFSFTNIAAGQTQLSYINTQKDGDFWLHGLGAVAFDHAAPGTVLNELARLSIVDSITGYSLFDPYVYVFNIGPVPGRPFNAGIAQANMQPVCYQRGTVIEITASTPVGSATQDIWGILYGWKEYANASQ